MAKIHYLAEDQKDNAYIIAKTGCGRSVHDVNEYSSSLEYVDCIPCRKKLKKDLELGKHEAVKMAEKGDAMIQLYRPC